MEGKLTLTCSGGDPCERKDLEEGRHDTGRVLADSEERAGVWD